MKDMRAGVHQFIGHAEQVHATVVHEAVDVDLPAFEHLFDQQVVRADAELREALQGLVVRLDRGA